MKSETFTELEDPVPVVGVVLAEVVVDEDLVDEDRVDEVVVLPGRAVVVDALGELVVVVSGAGVACFPLLLQAAARSIRTRSGPNRRMP